MKRDRRSVVITNARPSPGAERRSREIRYVLMMGVRALCLVAAAVLVSVHAPLLWLWVPVCLVGMVVVPWLAVILANDGPPKARYRLAGKLHHSEPPAPPPALPPADPPRVIEHED